MGKANPMFFPQKMPFEDKVREYIALHPYDTVQGCATKLGIGQSAVFAACVSLEQKGLAKWKRE